MLISRKLSPYDNPQFCLFLFSLIDNYLIAQTPQTDLLKPRGVKQISAKKNQNGLNLDVHTAIAILNIICIMNQEQFIFREEYQIEDLLWFLQSILDLSLSQQSQPNQTPSKFGVFIPSILRAAVIKTLGYLIQHEREKNIYTKSSYVCNFILGYCLSP
jgi:hypothetical protein